jgi:serine phosphatase RsbU (regulator of sigma subunit)
MFNQINDLNLNLEGLVEERTVQILQLNRQISDSIKVALAIQNSVLPDTSNFNHVFEDSFIYWKPKDIVSGDIYLARQLGEHDCFVMVADCTGHGVSGAFITMLIKAIEKDLILLREQGHLDMNNDLDVLSPSKMLQVFNRKLKELLNQHYQSEDIKLDFGFDGGVLYMNHKTKLGIYAGARMPLYICQSGKIKTLKPDKFSIGYSKSDINHEFNEYLIDFSTAQTIYMVTDGVLDQLGGPKGYPFGKKKFLNILEQNQDKSLAEQKSIIKKELTKYQQDFEQTDDRTIFALKI